MNNKLKASYVLSIIIIVLSLISALGGLFIDNLYRDNTFVNSAWRGNDLVTLFVAVPGLLVALFFAKRGSQRAQLVWLGMLENTMTSSLNLTYFRPNSSLTADLSLNLFG